MTRSGIERKYCLKGVSKMSDIVPDIAGCMDFANSTELSFKIWVIASPKSKLLEMLNKITMGDIHILRITQMRMKSYIFSKNLYSFMYNLYGFVRNLYGFVRNLYGFCKEFEWFFVKFLRFSNSKTGMDFGKS